MRSPSTRRYPSLLDLMILTAATGLAVALLRPYLATLPPLTPGATRGSLRTQEAIYGCWSLVAAWWMLALLLIQARRPRVSRFRLARQPGQVACIALMVSLVAGCLRLLVLLTLGAGPMVRPGTMQYQVWIQLSVQASPTILGAWSLLILSGRWRADRGWIDRLGRALGCCWVAWTCFFFLPKRIQMQCFALLPWFNP